MNEPQEKACFSVLIVIVSGTFLLGSFLSYNRAAKWNFQLPPSTAVTTPWDSLGNNSATPNLYVWVAGAAERRLGNQLYNYAALFGIAWRNGHVPLWPDGYSQVRSHFRIRIPVDRNNNIQQDKQTKSVIIHERGPCIYANETEHLPKRNVTLMTYLQSWKYYRDIEDQLRYDLTFNKDILVQANAFVTNSTPVAWKGLSFVRVVIHVRRTDHLTPAQNKNGWPIASAEYFNKSMSYFVGRFSRVQFVVLSDDLQWCFKHLAGPNVVFSQGHAPVVDLAIASLCDHAILTVGSFGMWAAWFANGITVTQKNIPIPGSPMSRALIRGDYFKPSVVSF